MAQSRLTTAPAVHSFLLAIAICLSVNAADGQGRTDQREHPPRPVNPPRGSRVPDGTRQEYSIEQALSDDAQLHTIAFNGLAFLTGDFGAATFMPPGKVCDFFGFQYMRDIDAAQKGHNPMFLDRAAANVLAILRSAQRTLLADLAREQAPQFSDLAARRWPVIKAFYRDLAGEIPLGSTGLNEKSVARAVGDFFAFDAELSYRRAEVFGHIAASLTAEQKAAFGKMKFGDFASWPEVEMEPYKLPRGTEKMLNVAYMTYASEFFSWYAGSVEADTYFCPERHGTYFGGFYMKDMPAMGKRNYDISTSVTEDEGQAFLNTLTSDQRICITDLVELQRASLQVIVTVRRSIATELRAFLSGRVPDKQSVIALGRRYGELDGEVSFLYASAFAAVNRSLSAGQRTKLLALRNLQGYSSAPAYLYSDPTSGTVKLPQTDFLFLPPASAAGVSQ